MQNTHVFRESVLLACLSGPEIIVIVLRQFWHCRIDDSQHEIHKRRRSFVRIRIGLYCIQRCMKLSTVRDERTQRLGRSMRWEFTYRFPAELAEESENMIYGFVMDNFSTFKHHS